MSDSQDPSLGQDEAEDVPFGASRLPPMAIAGIIAAVVPFTFRIDSLSTSSVNGVMTVSYSNPVAMIGGLVALICGLLLAANAVRKRPMPPTAVTWLIAVVLIGAGAWHALHGFGIMLPGSPG